MSAVNIALPVNPSPTLVALPAVPTADTQVEEAMTAAATPLPTEPPILPTATPVPTMPAPVETSTTQPTESLPTPAPTLESAQVEPTTQNTIRHVVRQDETLYDIALRYDVSIEAIIAASQLPSPDLLQIGQELLIPVGVQPADTAASVPSTAGTQLASTIPVVSASTLYACPDNTQVIPLPLPSDPIQLFAGANRLFLIADGALYEIALDGAGQIVSPTPTRLSPPQNIVDNYLIHELVYVTRDPAGEDLLLLDKTNDVYRYSPAGGWRMEVTAQPIPGQFPDPQYLTIQPRNGAVLALDTDLSNIWQLSPQNPVPASFFSGWQVASAVDMAFIQDGDGDTFYVLTREGGVTRINRSSSGYYDTLQLPIERVLWPSQVQIVADQLMVVDGQARSVRLYDRSSLAQVMQVIFRFPNMQRMRHAAVIDQTIYAVAGSNLYIAPLAQLNSECVAVAYDDNFYFSGINIHELLPQVRLPFPNAILPIRPRSYPGARRLYRFGLHQGLDLYALDAAGLHVGSPVQAIADGKITRIDTNFTEMTPAEYEEAMIRSKIQHRTAEAWFDRLVGRQVYVQHTPQVSSRYAHLDEVASLAVEDSVSIGAVIGTVGVSGTSAGAYSTEEGAHLHVEIWVNGRYLGQGLNLYETMRLWQELFR